MAVHGKRHATKLEQVSTHLGKTAGVSQAFIAELFGNAHPRFLEERTVESLGVVARDGAAEMKAFASAGYKGVRVRVSWHEGRAHAWVAMMDRPFIVNSIVECIRELGGRVVVMLHPIVQSDEKLISLSYVEITSLNADLVERLSDSLQSSLEDLSVATDSFSQIGQEIDGVCKVLDNPFYSLSASRAERKEVSELLQWLRVGAFVFAGSASWAVSPSGALSATPASQLGILSAGNSNREQLLNESLEDARRLVATGALVQIAKLRVSCPFHRRMRLNCVVVPEFSKEGRITIVRAFVGLLSSKAHAEESSSVPLIRAKLNSIIERARVYPNSHDFKKIVKILDAMPIEKALSRSADQLAALINDIVQGQQQYQFFVSVERDDAKRGIASLVVLPRARFHSEVIEGVVQYLERVLQAPLGSCEHHVDASSKQYTRIYFHCPTASDVSDQAIESMEAEIERLCQTWSDRLAELVNESADFQDQATTILARYGRAFDEGYQTHQTPHEALVDIAAMEKLTPEAPAAFRARLSVGGTGEATVALYHLGSQVAVSKIAPILEKAGFYILTERASCVRRPQSDVWAHRYVVRLPEGVTLSDERFEQLVRPALLEVFAERMENDRLNALHLTAGLPLEAVAVLRAYTGLLWQVQRSATRATVRDVVADAPALATRFWEIFRTKFDPSLKLPTAERASKAQAMLAEYRAAIQGVSDVTADKALRSLGELLEYTLRTNAFIPHEALAFKLRSEKISIMPQPRPVFEIYVHSPAIEGVHLRGYHVARGGLRWSERPDDFRTEILGLMKTQQVKNALIVPKGAKGGFILRKAPEKGVAVHDAVVAAYKIFIRSLLSITDNRVGETVKHPDNVLAHDGPDPYFVVAADKGTAMFSDIANGIAINEFNFWLGDAFASGGSVGYSHKDYGITAKGGWECVQRHFVDMGLEYVTKPFTVVGIGDMSGDVFGNGLILSDKMKLVAAFDHRHIFIDPNPDTAASFAERVRMFKLPRSSWADYSASLISAGGGVYPRNDKQIKLSREARTALGISDAAPEVMDGPTIMSHILRAPADLLWNGGIGTYVKASTESNADANDSGNDVIRISAPEVRVKVMGEGGNLGLTQRARIELDRLGVRLNTDAIDNSAGVDLSDHEVNLKILFSSLERQKVVSRDERNTILKAIANEVCDLVLMDNKLQALTVSMSVRRSVANAEYLRGLIREAHRLGHINRGLEVLPSDSEIDDRISKRLPFARPEVAVCIAGAKMWLKDIAIDSGLVKDPVCSTFLASYFPEKVRERFAAEIAKHPLADNIIATQLSALIIGLGDVSILYRMTSDFGVSAAAALRALVASTVIVGADAVREAIWKLDRVGNGEQFLRANEQLLALVTEIAGWLLVTHREEGTLSELVKRYHDAFASVAAAPAAFGDGELQRIVAASSASLTEAGIPAPVAGVLKLSGLGGEVGEAIAVALQLRKPAVEVLPLYAALLDALGASSLCAKASAIECSTRWDRELLTGSVAQIRQAIAHRLSRLVAGGATKATDVAAAISASNELSALRNLIVDVSSRTPSVSSYAVVAQKLGLK